MKIQIKGRYRMLWSTGWKGSWAYGNKFWPGSAGNGTYIRAKHGPLDNLF